MACSCPQCTGRPAAAETYEYEPAMSRRVRSRSEAVEHGLARRDWERGEASPPRRPSRRWKFARAASTAASARRGEPTRPANSNSSASMNGNRSPTPRMSPSGGCARIDMIYPDPDIPGAELALPARERYAHQSAPRPHGRAPSLRRRHRVDGEQHAPAPGQPRGGDSRPQREPDAPRRGLDLLERELHRSWRASLDFRFDYGIITLPDALGDRHSAAIGGPLGFWGSPTTGSGTQIVPVTRAGAPEPARQHLGLPGGQAPRHTVARLRSRDIDEPQRRIGTDLLQPRHLRRPQRQSRLDPVRERRANIVAIHTGPCIAGTRLLAPAGADLLPGRPAGHEQSRHLHHGERDG